MIARSFGFNSVNIEDLMPESCYPGVNWFYGPLSAKVQS